MLMKWPGTIKPGTVYNDIISLIDLFPTLCDAAGVPDIKEQLAKGTKLGDKEFKVHLDGYDFAPYFRGEQPEGPRQEIFYFDQAGNLNAVRYADWKVSFAVQHGNIAYGSRTVTNWAGITNLRMDPYEKGTEEGGESMKFFAQQMWLLVPIGNLVRQFFSDFEKFPYQAGTALNAGNINYNLLRTKEAMQRLKELESMHPSS
jgi:arylsulfatase